MLQAEIKGKVPEVEGMEDVLTSNVFGLLRYVQNPAVLFQILDQARTLSGKRLTECVGSDLGGYIPEFLIWVSWDPIFFKVTSGMGKRCRKNSDNYEAGALANLL